MVYDLQIRITVHDLQKIYINFLALAALQIVITFSQVVFKQ